MRERVRGFIEELLEQEGQYREIYDLELRDQEELGRTLAGGATPGSAGAITFTG